MDEEFEGLGDQDFEDPVVNGELAPFWQPQEDGEVRVAEVLGTRPTKDFGQGPGEAILLRGREGVFALPETADLAVLNWQRERGRVYRFTFKGWLELPDGPKGEKRKMRKFIAQRKKGDGIPF